MGTHKNKKKKMGKTAQISSQGISGSEENGSEKVCQEKVQVNTLTWFFLSVLYHAIL